MTIRYENREAARGDLRTPEGRAAIERFLAEYVADELRGPPKVLHAPGPQLLRRSQEGGLDHQPRVGGRDWRTLPARPVDPLRFRGNLHVSGWPAWHEFNLLGSEIAVGRKGAAESRQADRALRRDRGRSANRDPRPADPAHADGHLRSRRLRHLCRGDRGRRNRARRHHRGNMNMKSQCHRCDAPVPLMARTCPECGAVNPARRTALAPSPLPPCSFPPSPSRSTPPRAGTSPDHGGRPPGGAAAAVAACDRLGRQLRLARRRDEELRRKGRARAEHAARARHSAHASIRRTSSSGGGWR